MNRNQISSAPTIAEVHVLSTTNAAAFSFTYVPTFFSFYFGA
jgi:hypothetical protein